MLSDCGILTKEDNEQIQAGLDDILADIEAGNVEFSADTEDIHMNIETLLTERIEMCIRDRNVALLLQIRDVDGYRAPGEIQLRGQLVLRDGGVLLNDTEYFSLTFGHGSTSGQKFIF